MLATTFIFFSNDWPKRFINNITKNKYAKNFQITKLSKHCIYIKDEVKSESKPTKVKKPLEN